MSCIECSPASGPSCALQLSDLEPRIRELCAKAVAAEDPAELELILSELRDALREHVNHVRRMVAERALKSIRYSLSTANQDPS